MSSKAQIKISFISERSSVPLSRYSSLRICNHSIIYQIYDVMMSISLWDRVNFWTYVLNHNSLSHQTWPIDRYKQGQQFSEIFQTSWRPGAKFQVLFNSATCSNYSITSYFKISVFHFFEKVTKGHLTRSTTAMDPPAFKSQRVGYPSNQKLLHHYQH